jgi:hypothetical protein
MVEGRRRSGVRAAMGRAWLREAVGQVSGLQWIRHGGGGAGVPIEHVGRVIACVYVCDVCHSKVTSSTCWNAKLKTALCCT